MVARLPSGIDRGLAAEELRAINRRLFPLWKSSYQDEKSTWSMEDLKTNLVGDAAARAWLSLAAVIGQGLTVVGTGIVVGVAVAVGATRWLASLLFGVSTLDPSAYAGASMLLFGVALLACAIPALRAMRLQPATVLRNE